MFASGADPHFEVDYEEHANRYKICQSGFALIALGCFLRVVDVALHLALFFPNPRPMIPALLQVFDHPVYQWLVKGLMSLAMLLGPYLLWGRWQEAVWKRRTGLLLTIGLVDLLLWVLDNEESLGMQFLGDDHKWARLHVARAISWGQIYLGALIAADFLAHLDRPRVARGAQTILGFLAAGVSLWTLYLIRQTAWTDGWPLRQLPLDPLSLILLIAYLLPLTIASIQLMAVCLVCFREAAALALDLRAHAADPGRGLEALRSRSEVEDDG